MPLSSWPRRRAQPLGAVAAAVVLLVGCAPPLRVSGFAPPTNVLTFSHPRLGDYPLRRIAVLHFDNRTPSPEAGRAISEYFYEELQHRVAKVILPPLPVDYGQLSLEIPLGQRVGGRLPPPVVEPEAVRRVVAQLEPALREALVAAGLTPPGEPDAPVAVRVVAGGIPREIRLSEAEKVAIDASHRRAEPERVVDAIVVGVIGRYRNRQGHPLAVREPASVAYNIYLLSTVDGEVLWQAAFDETQVPLFENIMLLDRFVEGGGVWQTHDTLTRIGMGRVLSTFPGARPPELPPPLEPSVNPE